MGLIAVLAAVSVAAGLILITSAATPSDPDSGASQAGMEKKPVSAERLSLPRPGYEVRRTVAPLTIDGKVEPGEWSAAGPAISFIFPWDGQTGAKQSTSCYSLFTLDRIPPVRANFMASCTDMFTGRIAVRGRMAVKPPI